MAAGENRASTSVLADDGGVGLRRYLVEGVIFARLGTTLGGFGMRGCR
jgi:hypothetical protein